MFTIDQIKAAHSKVKTGADFPAYFQDIRKLGVRYYETFVADGYTIYFGDNNYSVSSGARYDSIPVSNTSHAEQFKADLKSHQLGNTDFPTFCSDCAKSGIEKWIVSVERMTCTYFDKASKEILVEAIPQ